MWLWRGGSIVVCAETRNKIIIIKTINRKRFQLLPSETLFISFRCDDSRYSRSGEFDSSP
jgi:hypothetical protein